MDLRRSIIVISLAALLLLPVPAAAPPPTPIEAPPEVLLTWDGHEQPYHMFRPQDVAVDRWGVMYVTDSGEARVLKFLTDGTYIGEWGGNGTAVGQFVEPRGIAVDPTGCLVYVVDLGNDRVQVFTDTGTFVDTLTTAIHNPPGPVLRFQEPHGIAVDADGNAYITDRTLHAVSKYDADLNFVQAWGGYGNLPGEFHEPLGVTVDDRGRIWVADSRNQRLQIFTASGTFVDEWAHGVGDIDIDEPWDLAIDGRGNVYVINNHGRLVKLDKDRVFLSFTTGFDMAEGLALFGNGMLYVANTGHEETIKLGYPSALTSIADMPGDQGLSVRLRWSASVLDRLDAPVLLDGYAVYRRLYGGSAAPPHPTGPGALAQEAEMGLEGWDVLATIPARGDSTYQYVAPTLCDSTSSGICWSVFLVSAFTSYGEFHDSAPDSGYSTDDIPPPVPGGLSVAENPGDLELQLQWDASAAPDFACFGVYRGTTPDFTVSDPYAPFATTTSPTYVDDTVASGETWYYRVAAFDDADACSGVSAAAGATVLTSADVSSPIVYGLRQNTPNPFNPATTIAYALRRTSEVELVVFDATGRRVRTLVDDVRAGGVVHKVTWDGTDDSGHAAAAGVYFCRLTARSLTETRKMVLLK